MCNPIALAAASLVVGIGSSVASYASQAQSARAQAQHQANIAAQRRQQIEQNNQLVQEDFRREQSAIQERQQQEQAAKSLEVQNIARQSRQARATTLTSAGESGVSGLSLDALLNDYSRQDALYRDALSQQQGFTTAQLQRQAEGSRMNAISAMNSLQPYIPAPVEQPSLFGAALQAGGNVLNTMGTYSQSTGGGNLFRDMGRKMRINPPGKPKGGP